MAFESLSDKLQNIFKNLRGKGRLSEADVKAALKEVKMALLEADVSFKVVKQFISSIQERAVGEEVFGSLTPGQTVIKIVTEELVKLMGSETTEIALKPGNEITVIMMAGLQGAGKTTTTAKIAAKLKAKGKKPILVACDVYRPAAIKQLQINGEKVDVPVFSMGDKISPVDIAKAAVEHASKNGFNVVIMDTAGRLHIDEGMMEELEQIKETVNVYQTILVVDAMTGQDAVNVSGTFNDKIGIDGVILTKLDGDTRGGAALSIRSVTGKPILYIGMGYLGNYFPIPAKVMASDANKGVYVLSEATKAIFGPAAQIFLAGMVTVTCFTTTAGLIVSTGEFFHNTFPKISYKVYATIFTLIGFAIANLGLSAIIAYSLPVLMILYPITITIVLIVIVNKFTQLSKPGMQLTIFLVSLVAIADVLASTFKFTGLANVIKTLPFAAQSLPWLLPAVVGIVLSLFLPNKQSAEEE